MRCLEVQWDAWLSVQERAVRPSMPPALRVALSPPPCVLHIVNFAVSYVDPNYPAARARAAIATLVK